MAQKNYSLVPCNQLLNEGLSLYDIEKEEKNLCVKKCCERRWTMILYICWRWSWPLYYVCDPLSSIFLWIHFFVVLCYVFFLLSSSLWFDLCCRGVHKWCSQAWSYLQCFFKQKFKHVEENMMCIVCYPKGGCNVKNVHKGLIIFHVCGFWLHYAKT